jgi:hypothetical protein
LPQRRGSSPRRAGGSEKTVPSFGEA